MRKMREIPTGLTEINLKLTTNQEYSAGHALYGRRML